MPSRAINLASGSYEEPRWPWRLAVGVMLLKLNEEIRECYGHAFRAREKANAATDEVTRQYYLDAEVRWLYLAHSYELSERISSYTGVRPGGRRG